MKSRRAWSSFVAKVAAGLDAAGIERDFFSPSDLQELARRRFTPERIVEAAKQRVAHDGASRAQREGATP